MLSLEIKVYSAHLNKFVCLMPEMMIQIEGKIIFRIKVWIFNKYFYKDPDLSA